MLAFPTPSVYEASKCYVTYGTVGHLDPKQPPSKGKPWSKIKSLDFIRKVEILLPQHTFNAVHDKLIRGGTAPTFKRVVMSLSDMVTGPFYEKYLKQGDTMMLSEGRIGVDDVFCLRNGNLQMFLEKETYERAGLVGKPHGAKGNRGLKPRWIVEINLNTLSSKKVYERLVYATKNALGGQRTWLFHSLDDTDQTCVEQFLPTNFTCNAATVKDMVTLVPHLRPDTTACLSPGGKEDFDYFASEIYEWISLVRLGSARTQPQDEVDPYLCRYRVPGESSQQQQAEVCKITWQGFLCSNWALTVLHELVEALPSKSWYTFTASTFGESGDECTILRPPDAPGEYLMWEVKSEK